MTGHKLETNCKKRSISAPPQNVICKISNIVLNYFQNLRHRLKLQEKTNASSKQTNEPKKMYFIPLVANLYAENECALN